MAQESRIVTGIVTSEEDGEPVIGASVMIPNSNVGTTTDVDGNFSLKVPANVSVLRFSFVGMTTVDVPVKDKMSVVLSTNDKVLEDVVVTAQGLTRKEKSIGYAAQKLGGEDLTVSRPIDLANSMAGKVSGARIMGGSGATFDVGTVVLRGTGDFQNPIGSEPIYVVDGIVTNKNAVNMDDVDNLTVLKGAGATALYGSQGGNGAIVITTKRAKAGKGRIEVTHTTKWETYYNHIDVQHQYGGGSYGLYGERYAIEGNDNMSWAGLEVISKETKEGFINKNEDGSYQYDMNSDESWGARYDKNVLVSDAWYFDPTSKYYYVNHKARPWVGKMDLADLFRTGINNTTNVSFSKAGEDYSVRASYTNSQREGILENSDATRRFFSFRSSYDPIKWLTVSADYKFTYHRNHNAAAEGYNNANNVFYNFVEWGQTNIDIDDLRDYKRADGSWRTWNVVSPTDLRANYHDNAFGILHEMNRYHTSFGHLFSADLEARLPFKIKAGFKFMGDMRNNERESCYAEGAKKISPSTFELAQYRVSDVTSQGRLTWGDRFFDDRFSIDAAGFLEVRHYRYSYIHSGTSNGLVNGTGWWSVSNSTDFPSTVNTRKEFKTRSGYANVTMGFDDTYFLDASLRRDFDSRLDSPSKKTKNNYLYGGVSASVMLDKFVNLDWLSYWKVRGSQAQVGSTLEAYQLDTPYYTYAYDSQQSFYTSSTQVSDDIKPTITTSYEFGTEFRMFNDRIWGDINYYVKNTKDQIFELDVTPASGYASRLINCGEIDNHGIEISLGATAFRNRDWKVDFNFNISRNHNKLVKLADGMSETLLASKKITNQWSLRAIEGKPVGVITTSNRWLRDDNGELILEKSKSNMWGGGYAPVYKNQTEKEVGNYQPDYTGGFSANASWKNLSLSLNFDYMIGGQMVSLTNTYGTCSGILTSTTGKNSNGVNVREAIIDGGGVDVHGVDKEGNPVDCKMNAYYYYHYKAKYDIDSWVYDRTYLKLRDVSVSYQFDKKTLDKLDIGLSQASVSFVANNLWLIYSACPNIDPSEMSIDNSSTSNKLVSAFLEGAQAPSTRSYGLTVKVAF